MDERDYQRRRRKGANATWSKQELLAGPRDLVPYAPTWQQRWQQMTDAPQPSRAAQIARRLETETEGLEAADKLQQIRAWCEAYPINMFPEPDWVEVTKLIGPELLTRVSASNMRHVVEGVRRIIDSK